jgi:hypothetical protein
MIAVRMVEVALDQIVDVVSVRNRFVSTIGPVTMSFVVSPAIMFRRADIGIRRTDDERMFFHHAAFLVMQVAIVQVIDMPIMDDSGVAAVWTVFVGMVVVMSRHGSELPCWFAMTLGKGSR